MDQFLDKFSKLPLLYKGLGLVTIVILMFLGFNQWVQQPLEAKNRQIRSNIEKKNMEKEDISYKILHLTEVEQEIRRLKNQLNDAISLLPVKSELPALLKQLSTLAEKSGLKIVKFKPLPEVNRRYYFEVPAMLDLEGNFHEATNFFDQVGKMRRVVNVSNVKMSRLKDCGNDGFSSCKDANNRLEIQCRAVTYRFAATELTK